MQHSESINEIAAALAKAQGAISNPGRNREVAVKSPTGASYKFRYATLDAILNVVRQPLAENGLAFAQSLGSSTEGRFVLTTILTHASGQWLRSETPVTVQGTGMQQLGSAQTYARRYAISSMLGIATDDDDDGNAADGNAITETKSKPARTAPPPTVPVGNGESKPGHIVWFEARWAELEMVMTPKALEAWAKKNKPERENLREKAPELADKLTARFNEKWKEPVYAS